MKASVIFLFVFNCVVYIRGQVTREPLSESLLKELLEDVPQPKVYCGQMLNKAMKRYCNADARRIIEEKSKRSVRGYGYGYRDMDENSIDNYIDNVQEDTWNDFDIDLLPYYIYNSRGMFKRQGYMTITQACCKKACHLSELVQYCPPKI